MNIFYELAKQIRGKRKQKLSDNNKDKECVVNVYTSWSLYTQTLMQGGVLLSSSSWHIPQDLTIRSSLYEFVTGKEV